MSRREQIEAMLKEEPRDIMLRYMLARELEKESRNEESLRLFLELAGETPAHVPSFFMAGQQYARLGRIEEARATLRNGIEAARAQGDSHAAGEMSEFLAGLGRLGE